jgi:hypothetical protein
MTSPDGIGLNGMTRIRRMATSSTYAIMELSLRRQRNVSSTTSRLRSMNVVLMMFTCWTGIQIEENGCGWYFRIKGMV